MAMWNKGIFLNIDFRFLTILYYLNDVPQGGETAFPVADESNFNKTVRMGRRGQSGTLLNNEILKQRNNKKAK